MATSPAWAVHPEVDLCATSLRDGERAKAEAVLGPLQGLTLYQAEINVEPGAASAHGRELIAYRARRGPLSRLFLRLTPNVFWPHAVTLTRVRRDGKDVAVRQVRPGLLEVPLVPAVPVGEKVTLDLELAARLPRAAQASGLSALAMGGAKTDHGAFGVQPGFASLVGILPQVPPVDAQGRPSQGPSGVGDLALYEPGNYLVSVVVPRGFRAYAPGNALGELPLPDGRLRFSFGAAAVRDFPLYVARGYQKAEQRLGDLAVESDFRASDAKQGKQVLRLAVSALKALQAHLGKVPWAQFRVVEAPLTGGAGGMEFPGLVTVGQALYGGQGDPLSLLGLGGLSGLSGLGGLGGSMPALGGMMQELLAFTVAHEVAHQYFAELVGSDPIAEPIVDEALAQYVAVLYLEWTKGEAAAARARQDQLVLPFQLFRMLGGQDGIADRPTTDFPSELAYAALVYGKAPMLFDAQSRLIGEPAFVRGLRAYVDAYRFRWTCSDCLTQLLGKLNPAQAPALEALRRRWWLEAHGDADLGRVDLAAMVQQMTGATLDPKSQALLQQLLSGMGGP